MCEQLHDVKEIPRMLAIQCGNELAAVDILGSQDRDFQVGQKGVARHRRHVGALHWVNRASKDGIDFDLYLNGSATSY